VRCKHPIAFASVIAFVMTAVITFFLVPYSNYATRKLLFNIAKQRASISIKEKEMTFRELTEKIKKSGLKETAIRELAIELNKKLSIPFSCIIFGIIGVPLGIRESRTGKSRGFAVGLLVVLTYYMLQLGGEAFAETGKLPPIIGVWSPNLILGAIGVYLFAMAVRERPIRFKGLL
jgi:Predicted permeases